MKEHWKLFKYIISHKFWVFRACLHVGVPIWIAILHDWDKFTPVEWFGYIVRFKGKGDYETKLKRALSSDRYQMAWHMHQKRNKHHWQWWTTPKDDGTLRIIEMQSPYREEMLADWLAMNNLSYTATRKWYEMMTEQNRIQLHPNTREWIESKLYDEKDNS